MEPQEHTQTFGEGEEAILVVHNPPLQFWKNATIQWDLSKCSEKNQSEALSAFTAIMRQKVEKRKLAIPIKLSVIG